LAADVLTHCRRLTRNRIRQQSVLGEGRHHLADTDVDPPTREHFRPPQRWSPAQAKAEKNLPRHQAGQVRFFSI